MMGTDATAGDGLILQFEVIQEGFSLKRMIISTKALKSHTVFVSKLLEVMFSLENFTDAQGHLIV